MSRLITGCIATLALFAIGAAGGAGTPPSPPPSSGPMGMGMHDPPASALPITFDSEWIRLFIVGDSLEVRGTYWLCCHRPTEREFPLIYPFPEDSLLGGARMVSVSARVDSAAFSPVRVENVPGFSGVRWRVPPCTGDTIEIESVYRQKIRREYARYIVTTTRAWNRPLRRARFEIHLPPAAVPAEFSFPFVRQERDGEVFFTYEEMSFLPDHDISVRWRR